MNDRFRLMNRWAIVSLVAVAILSTVSSDGSEDSESGFSAELSHIEALIHEGEYAEADQEATAFLKHTELRYGRRSGEAAKVLDVLVFARIRGGKVSDPETLSMAERAIAIKRDAFGEASPLYADSLNGLSTIHSMTGRYDDALELLQDALGIYGTDASVDHARIGSTLHNLAVTCSNAGHYEKGKEYAIRALEIRRELHGERHRDVADTWSSLGILHSQLGDYAQAQACRSKAFEIRAALLPHDHPELAASYLSLGNLSLGISRFDATIDYYEKARVILQTRHDPISQPIADLLLNLELAHFYAGGYEIARHLSDEAYKIRVKLYGPNSAITAEAQDNLAMALATLGEHQRARDLYEQALKTKRQTPGASPYGVGLALNALGALLEQIGEYAEARRAYEDALENWSKVLELISPQRSPTSEASA